MCKVGFLRVFGKNNLKLLKFSRKEILKLTLLLTLPLVYCRRNGGTRNAPEELEGVRKQSGNHGNAQQLSRQSEIPAGRRSAAERAAHVSGGGAIPPESAGKDFTSQGSPEIRRPRNARSQANLKLKKAGWRQKCKIRPNGWYKKARSYHLSFLRPPPRSKKEGPRRHCACSRK